MNKKLEMLKTTFILIILTVCISGLFNNPFEIINSSFVQMGNIQTALTVLAEVETHTYTYGEVFGSLPNVTRECYSFNGWYTSGGTKVTESTIVNDNFIGGVTLYAQWQESHSYVNNVSSTYLKSAATCTSAAVYYKSCEGCGKKSSSTFSSGSASGHTLSLNYESYSSSKHYAKEICVNCGTVESSLLASHSFSNGKCLYCNYVKVTTYDCACNGCSTQISSGSYCSTCYGEYVCSGCNYCDAHETFCYDCYKCDDCCDCSSSYKCACSYCDTYIYSGTYCSTCRTNCSNCNRCSCQCSGCSSSTTTSYKCKCPACSTYITSGNYCDTCYGDCVNCWKCSYHYSMCSSCGKCSSHCNCSSSSGGSSGSSSPYGTCAWSSNGEHDIFSDNGHNSVSCWECYEHWCGDCATMLDSSMYCSNCRETK